MSSEGLVAIRDASSYLLADRATGLGGSMLAACIDGQRPYVCEIQALVAKNHNPAAVRRTAVGVDNMRLPLLVAVLQRHADLQLGSFDVFVSAVGGLRVTEPACDLPAALAMLSSFSGKALPD